MFPGFSAGGHVLMQVVFGFESLQGHHRSCPVCRLVARMGAAAIAVVPNDSRTRLILTRSRPSADMLDAYAVGTQLHLENLVAHLTGHEPIDPEPFWSALHPRYTALAAATARADAG